MALVLTCVSFIHPCPSRIRTLCKTRYITLARRLTGLGSLTMEMFLPISLPYLLACRACLLTASNTTTCTLAAPPPSDGAADAATNANSPDITTML